MKIATTPCPKCGGVGTLTMDAVLVAQDPTTLALAGVQLKTGATEAPRLTCSCGWATTGRYYVSDTGKKYAEFQPKETTG